MNWNSVLFSLLYLLQAGAQLLAVIWLLDHAWRLSRRDLNGADPYRVLLAPILVVALFSAFISVNLIRFGIRFPGRTPWWGLMWLPPVACAVPRVGRQVKWVVALAAVPGLGYPLYTLFLGWSDSGLGLSCATLACGVALIVRCVTTPPGEDPQQSYRERLPLLVACALFNVVLLRLVLMPWGSMTPEQSPGRLQLLGVCSVVALIPALGRSKAAVISATVLALVPAGLWALAFLIRAATR